MGYWGHLVLARSGGAPEEFGTDAEPVRDYAGGWRVHRAGGEGPDLPGAVRALATRTGAPALAGYVLDSDCAVLAAATPDGPVWSTLLNPDLAAEYGAPRPDPGADLDAALRWAVAGGLAPDEAAVRAALAGAATFVEDQFFALLDALGLREG